MIINIRDTPLQRPWPPGTKVKWKDLVTQVFMYAKVAKDDGDKVMVQFRDGRISEWSYKVGNRTIELDL